MTVEWKETKTSMKVGTRTEVDQLSGKKKIKANTVEVSYNAPKVSDAENPGQFAQALEEIISKGEKGYDSWPKVLSHLNYGLVRHVAVMFNSGQNTTLTPEQRAAVKMLYGLVKMGSMPRADALKYMALQQIEDPEEIFSAFEGNPDDGEDNPDNGEDDSN